MHKVSHESSFELLFKFDFSYYFIAESLTVQPLMQVGGWTEVYKGLTFATVRGAGHEVPLFQPRRAFILFRSFLAGEELPKS